MTSVAGLHIIENEVSWGAERTEAETRYWGRAEEADLDGTHQTRQIRTLHVEAHCALRRTEPLSLVFDSTQR